MNISAPFIRRPVATTLLTIAIVLAGMLAFFNLPVSSLPQIDFATITVATTLPGASPEVMASSVATPLERQFGHIAGVTQMTSSSTLGVCSVTLQFDLSRDVDGAARDVEAAINAARTYLPANLPANPVYQKDQLRHRPGDGARPYFLCPRQGRSLRHRLLHHSAEVGAGGRRWPGAGRRQRAACRAHRRQSAATE